MTCGGASEADRTQSEEGFGRSQPRMRPAEPFPVADSDCRPGLLIYPSARVNHSPRFKRRAADTGHSLSRNAGLVREVCCGLAAAAAGTRPSRTHPAAAMTAYGISGLCARRLVAAPHRPQFLGPNIIRLNPSVVTPIQWLPVLV